MTLLTLLESDGTMSTAALEAPHAFTLPTRPLRSRVAYAAAHVVPRVTAENVPGAPADIDWDATLAFRRHIWSWGLGVADAMDTAQRNMGLDWAACSELIRRSSAEARATGADIPGGALVVGVNTDHLLDDVVSLDDVIRAYLFQLETAEDAGAGVVLMASRHLARAAESAADYERVYREVLDRTSTPVILHWLGPAFDRALTGYFGSRDTATASDTVTRIITENAGRVRGIKMSLLDSGAEIGLRRRLPEGVRMFTGDDFNYVGLIEGDGETHSDALLGAFAAIAPNASGAIQSLDAGNGGAYLDILGATEALSRQVFAAPTQHYKTGIAFLSWLNGHQKSFSMVGGIQSSRSLVHLSKIVRLANIARALEHPDLSAELWHRLLAVNGIS